MADLDDIDMKIIRLLQENSRTSVADIAREIGELTENAIRYRIDKLESDGYIPYYTIRLDPEKFGMNSVAILQLNVLPQFINASLDYLASVDSITEVYLTSGRFNITAIGFFHDNAAIESFIAEDLKQVKMIDYDIVTVLKRVKHGFFSV